MPNHGGRKTIVVFHDSKHCRPNCQYWTGLTHRDKRIRAILLHVIKKSSAAQLSEQPLFATNPEAALPLLSMIGEAQLSIEDLLGQLSRQFIEQMLVLSAKSVAGAKHPGRHGSDIRWHGAQSKQRAHQSASENLRRRRFSASALAWIST